MSRIPELRDAHPEDMADAQSALQSNGEAADAYNTAKAAYARSAQAAQLSARAVLTILCNNEQIPMIERAGWSTAFHASKRTLTSLGEYEATAEMHKAGLERIDASLRVTGAPILAIMPGNIGDFNRDPSAIRYSVCRSAGKGLTIKQAFNDMQHWHYHWVEAVDELPDSTGPSRGYENGTRHARPLIANITTDSLLAACIDPKEAVNQVVSDSKPTSDRYFVIGDEALRGFFAEGEWKYDARFDMMLGAVAAAGVTL